MNLIKFIIYNFVFIILVGIIIYKQWQKKYNSASRRLLVASLKGERAECERLIKKEKANINE